MVLPGVMASLSQYKSRDQTQNDVRVLLRNVYLDGHASAHERNATGQLGTRKVAGAFMPLLLFIDAQPDHAQLETLPQP